MQKDHRTVQQELETALGKALGGPPVTIWGAGRTDAGVHARGQVAHSKVDTHLGTDQLQGAMNSYLPPDVHVLTVQTVPLDFHARHTSARRHYSYALTTEPVMLGRQYVWYANQDMEHEWLHRCASLIMGQHDFTGFAKLGQEKVNPVCKVSVSRWDHDGPQWTYHIEADHFLRHMVRYLVGTMIDVARGRNTSDDFEAQLDGHHDRLIVNRAPAHGLVLEEVIYGAA